MDFSTDNNNPLQNGAIVFSPITAGPGTLTYSWNFGIDALPATSTTSGPQTVIYTTTGPKTVSLQICDNAGNCLTESKTNFVNVGTAVSELAVDFSSNRGGANVGDNIQLTSNVSGGTAPYSYLWDFGGPVILGHFSDVNPLIAYSAPGYKNVRLTVTDAAGNTATKTRNSLILVNCDEQGRRRSGLYHGRRKIHQPDGV